MKTLSTHCRNCGIAMQIEVEDSNFFTDEGLCQMATCDRCYEIRERIERSNREKYERQVEKEISQDRPKTSRYYKKPYTD
jgi:hypothetical protein